MIVTPERTQPERMPEHREEKVRQALKELDELLDIKWVPLVRIRNGKPEGRYALICRWPSIDKRWEMYRRGEIGEPFDIMGYFETQDGEMAWHAGGGEPVNPDMVMDQTLELLGKCDNTRQSWKTRLEQSARNNRELVRKRRAAVTAEAVQGFKYYGKWYRGEPLVPGADLSVIEPNSHTEE